jgi:DNA replication and repair protein RecF
MLVRRLSLTNLRCRGRLELTLGDGINVLVGPNGAGKTTVLEAAALALQGATLRAGSVREMISQGRDHLRVELQLEDQRGTMTAAAAYGRDGTRRLTADGALLEDPSRWQEALPLRTFVPDDLRLIKGSPRRRRDYLDALASRSHPDYESELRRYDEALSQRNVLLRGARGHCGSAEFEPWETILARAGLAVCGLRAGTLAAFMDPFRRTHEELTGTPGEMLRLVYRTNASGLDEDGYRRRLAEMRALDQQRTYTQLGPHRDDLRLLRSGLDVRECASQGEQRMAVLTLVLAEWAELCAGPVKPLLLLDDVMSELDEERRRALVAFVRRGGQVLITTTDLRYFTPAELESATVIDLGDVGEGGDGGHGS